MAFDPADAVVFRAQVDMQTLHVLLPSKEERLAYAELQRLMPKSDDCWVFIPPNSLKDSTVDKKSSDLFWRFVDESGAICDMR
jgi:hypothetical protein